MVRLLSKQHFNDALRAAIQVQAEAGYSYFLVMADGGTLCLDCAWENRGRIVKCTYGCKDHSPEWEAVALEQHYEGEPIQCDNCYNLIEPTYGED